MIKKIYFVNMENGVMLFHKVKDINLEIVKKIIIVRIMQTVCQSD